MNQKAIGIGYFGGLNNEEGFRSFFPDITKNISYLYAIKGGPGNGKSYFMNRIREEAEKRGLITESVYCGSDPISLDGVLIPAIGIGVFDGTSPHLLDPDLPAVNGEWICFDSFLDREVLANEREQLYALLNAKKDAFRRVKEATVLCAEADREISVLVGKAIDMDKIQRTADRIARNLGKGSGKEKVLQVRSYGMRGQADLPTLELLSSAVKPVYGRGAEHFLSCLRSAAEKNGTDVIVSYHPIVSGRPADLLFPDTGILYTERVRKASESGINMERFLKKDLLRKNRSALRILKKIRTEAYRSLSERFDDVRRCHFAIEEKYGKALNIKTMEAYEKKMVQTIFESVKQ